MDPLTHILITRKVISPDRKVVLAGLAADVPFYLTYPTWLVQQGQIVNAFRKNEWPEAPKWMQIAHHIFHSLPVLLAVTVLIRLIRGRWSLEALAWGLHIVIDIPTHSRRHWAPQFLWPLSDTTVDGTLWTEVILSIANRLLKRLG